jgi:hypothetical protein
MRFKCDKNILIFALLFIKVGKMTGHTDSVRILLSYRNLTDRVYYDHLSRFKLYGLNDLGRYIVLNVGWQF